MALQASGSISASDISREFGQVTNISFGAYRISQTVGGLTRPLDDGIPGPGQPIKFSEFYDKKLNVVVNYTSATTVTRVTARSDYDLNNSRVIVIGGFKSRPRSSANTKVWIHTNGTIGSNANTRNPPDRTYSALRTGSWDSNTELILDVGPSGIIIGSGGDGGNGGKATTEGLGAGRGANLTEGKPGKNGTSAIGIQYTPIVLRNRGGIISGGKGGGGGGGAGYGNYRDANVWNETIGRQTSTASGSGGGGGRGEPAGRGGLAGDAGPSLAGEAGYVTNVVAGNSGNDGTIINGGRGGNSSFLLSNIRAAGGAGGGGSPNGEFGTAAPAPTTGTNATVGISTQGGTGGNGYGTQDDGAGFLTTLGGAGGLGGYSIVANGPSDQVDIQNYAYFDENGVEQTGEISGDKIYDTPPA